jgi:hypothetical protein
MKKLMTAFLAIGLVLSMAGMAAAQTCEVNMYGASAQGEFWDAGIKAWMELALASGGAGCTAPIAGPTKYTDPVTGIIHVFATGTGCDIPTCPNIVIRYSSKSSCEGIKALACSGDPDGCGNPCQRKMHNEASPNTLKCVDVTHAASDVAPASLIQSSAGQLLGPLGGGYTTKSACGVAQNPAWSVHRPFIVPFGFFLNQGVTQKRCVLGANDGEICAAPGDCPAPGVCTALPLDQMSRLMATQIFSGQAWNWGDFGQSFNPLNIEACFRHGGSGTHATLDFAVMRGRDWGWPLPTMENKAPAQPTIYFNNATGDMMNCVNGQGDGVNAPLSSGNNTTGRAGYADADRTNKTYTYGPVKYNGYKPYRWNVRNGLYDNFWSAAYVFDDCGTVSGCGPVQTSMFAWASQNVPGTKSNYWTPGCEMTFMKATDDVYPGFVAATCPKAP